MSRERSIRVAELYLDDDDVDMRDVAPLVGVSVFTVHRDLTRVLPQVDSDLAVRVAAKIENQLFERSRRGGRATQGVARWRGWGRTM